ncbi:MAG: multicopper oxidase family protein [Gemmatimonadota bacterium]|jgi:FtsP/CotA-like multicopper oxidase with cupredoxin domain
MDRRSFIGLVGASAVLPSTLSGLERYFPQEARRHPLSRPPTTSADGFTMTARQAAVDVGPGSVQAYTINGTVPSPTIRTRQGERIRIDLVNQLSEPTIMHWHGLAVPQEADGHPRLAIDPGQTYSYDYPILNRAGTYWYHPHPHHRTAAQTYLGLGGFLIVADDEEDGYELPSGDYELPLMLQDKRLGGGLSLSYDVARHDLMHGLIGDTAVTNGVVDATVDVSRTRYRLRIANGCNARILNLGLSNGASMTVIGSDGGLVDAPTHVDRILLAPAERADVVVDFSGASPGERVMLRSFTFDVPGMMGMGGMGRGGGGRGGRGGGGRGGRGGRGGMGMMGGDVQGATEMDFLEFVVQDARPEAGPPLPARFAPVPDRGEPTGSTPRQTFTFTSSMMGPGGPMHAINGLQFEMLRVDARIPRMESQIWTFVNDSQLPHPVHAHAGQFRPISRTGGRGRLMPWEDGLKDTILILPGESVDVMARFYYEGLYLLHCHNLEHEDMDMMINFEVV